MYAHGPCRARADWATPPVVNDVIQGRQLQVKVDAGEGIDVRAGGNKKLKNYFAWPKRSLLVFRKTGWINLLEQK